MRALNRSARTSWRSLPPSGKSGSDPDSTERLPLVLVEDRDARPAPLRACVGAVGDHVERVEKDVLRRRLFRREPAGEGARRAARGGGGGRARAPGGGRERAARRRPLPPREPGGEPPARTPEDPGEP